MFHPVRTSRASEDIVQQIKAQIFAGQIVPGHRLLTEMELTEQFRVSRTTVRDALRVLESQGLIDIKVGAGGGAFVAAPSTQPVSDSLTNMLRMHKSSIKELVEARLVVETSIVALAARRATAADLRAMEQAIAAARAGLVANDPYFMPHSVAFHIALAEAAKNEVLLSTVNSFRSLFYETLEKLFPAPDMAQRAIEDHQKILDAVKVRDAERPQQIMRVHLLYFEARAVKLNSVEESPTAFVHPQTNHPVSKVHPLTFSTGGIAPLHPRKSRGVVDPRKSRGVVDPANYAEKPTRGERTA